MKRNVVALFPLLAAACALIAGCSSGARSNEAINAMDVSEVAKRYYRDWRWALPEELFAKHTYELDQHVFLRLHRDEMLKTLEVVEAAETPNVAVAFVRYSIGTTIYRDAVWMRKVDDGWHACLSPYFYQYADDPFGDGKPDAAKALIKRVDDWKKESPKSWW